MRQGFCIFVELPPGQPVSSEVLDWRAPGQALPAHSRPLLIEDEGGVQACLHDYPKGWRIGGRTIAEVAEEARQEMAAFA